MKISDIIHAPKKHVSFGEWSEDKPKKKDFPMSRRKRGGAFPLTRRWRWTTVSFEALERHFIVMIAYHRDVPEYQAVLAESLSNDTRTLARLEYHANHPVPGWHVHGSCGAVDDLDLGVTKPNGQKRFPGVHNRHRKGYYCLEGDSMNDNMALEIAAKKFAFPFTKDLLGSVAP